MSQTIQDFYRVAQQRDFARDYMLRVVSIGNNTFNEDDFVYITTATLPDRAITNQNATYMGLKFNFPGTVTYPGSEKWDITFRADKAGLIRNKLETWQRSLIFDDQTSTGDLSVRGTNSVIQLNQIDDKLNVLNTYTLYGAYLQSLGAIKYDITGTGKVQEFTASLAYHFWTDSVVGT
jgi:hypothetical protein